MLAPTFKSTAPPSDLPSTPLSLMSPAATNQAPSDTVMVRREDFPAVKYWHRHEWNDKEDDATEVGERARGKSRSAKGMNVKERFIEDEKGQTIDGHRARDIRAHARSIWIALADRKRAPATWGKADMETIRNYRHEMKAKFPELRLCDNDWKADLVATINYPSWRTNYIKSNIVKEEHPEGDAQLAPPSQCSSSSKRSLQPLETVRPAKKPKTTERPSTQVCTPIHPASLTNSILDLKSIIRGQRSTPSNASHSRTCRFGHRRRRCRSCSGHC
jgi:hypothetical protein